MQNGTLTTVRQPDEGMSNKSTKRDAGHIEPTPRKKSIYASEVMITSKALISLLQPFQCAICSPPARVQDAPRRSATEGHEIWKYYQITGKAHAEKLQNHLVQQGELLTT